MNLKALTCPSQQQLAAFVAGRLNLTESTEIEQHLEDCESCCQLLKMLPDEDTLVSLLRDPRAETANEGAQRPLPAQYAATMPPTGERLTLPPSDGVTEIADAAERDAASSLPEPLRDHSRYRITEILGRGGMGDVYKAHHRMMNRAVALKVINAQLVKSHAAVQRFHREVQAAARLTHPNIVTAFDAEQAGDTHYLVMEFVDGVELADVIKDRGPLPVAEACDYVRQAALGLQHAHEQGMVHRDIKPQNLMLTSAGVVKILDFGLANLAGAAAEEMTHQESGSPTGGPLDGRLTQLGSMMGTPDYMAPEQADDAHSADIRADIYSLGCTLYCLLAGEAPFSAGSAVDKVHAHARQAARPLSKIRDDVPTELEAAIARMMNKSPGERYQLPLDVAKVLAPFAVTPSPNGHAASKPMLKSEPSSNLPLAIVVTLMLGLFIAMAGAIVVVTNRGRMVIQSEVGDVQVVVKQNGEEITMIDVKTGTRVKWLSAGEYEVELVGGDNDVKLDKTGFRLTRLGTLIVTARWNGEGSGVIRSFTTDDPTISQDNVEVADGGWKITASNTQSVRLFEVPMPPMNPGPFFYRAKMKTENVKGRAYLEMWVRIPGMGEFFSKGFHLALTGSNGWAEYEIPCLLEKGQQPDQVKLNLTIEGGGTVWIKDVEVRGRTGEVSDRQQIQGAWVAESGQRNGEAAALDQIGIQRAVFEGDTLKVAMPGGIDGEGTFELRTSDNPKQIWIQVEGRSDGMRGIYKLDGDRLTLCMNQDRRGSVPKEFAAPSGTMIDVIVLRRDVGLPQVFDEFLGEFDEVIRWRRGLLSAEQEKRLLSFRPDLVQEWQDERGRAAIELFATLPDAAHTELRKTGYLKWRIADVPLAHQNVYRQGFQLWTQHGEWTPEMVENSEVGFAVVQLANWKVVSAFILHPNDTAEAWATVVGLREHGDNDHRAEHAKQIRALRAKPLTANRLLDDEAPRVSSVSDHDRLQGKWVPISVKFRGEDLTAEQLSRMAIELNGDRAALTDPDSGVAQTGRFSIDATRSPKHIDFIAPDASERMPGIFEFDGEQLKLAWCDGDYARPPDFEPAQTPDHMTAVLKQVPGSVPATLPHDELAAAPVLDETQQQVVKAAEAYLSVVDEGKFGSLWNMVSSWAKRQVTREQVSQTYQKLRDTFGKAERRTLERVLVYDEFPGLPKGRYAAVQYRTDFERQKGLWEVLVLNIDTDEKWRVNSYQVTLVPPPLPEAKADPATEQKLQAARAASLDWLKLVDAGNYGEVWETSAQLNKDAVSKEQLIEAYNGLFQPLGKLTSRAHQTSQYTTQLPGATAGEYAAIQFRTRFTNGGVTETVVLTREAEGLWRVSGYFHAEDKSVPTPPPSLPVGENLIIDPSLENTAPGERYPQGWGTGNIIPKDAYKHQVVDGGRTGDRGWMIEGDGQYAVIPTNRPAAHSAYRYAARAWVKIEAGSAQIKLLYFDAAGQYLGENRGTISFPQDGWHRLTMIDDLAEFPTATKLSLAATLIGKGKAVFDDFEMLAFEADKLPENFEAEYGGVANDTAAVFDRWVGRWESTTVYKPTANSPDEETIKGELVVRKILDNRFLLWQWIGEESGQQYITILGFDEHMGGYHIWLFGSDGEAYERIGQWDAASQTLTLQVKPPSPGVTGTSIDRFVNDDRIESTLLVKANGQVTRDMHATWVRKSSNVEDDIAFADGPVSGVDELALLSKMAGDWTIKQTNKPSVWLPDGATETINERTAWAIGGRYLLFRSFKVDGSLREPNPLAPRVDDKQMNSLALMTWDAKDNSYRYWHFASDAIGGQWRITWDASSRGFHWRSIDMPAGWIGTGFNRWIDDDTFDNQALIKDEKGRVLLDSTQDKRRTK